MKSKTINSLFWKLLERFGVSGVQFVLQILLARLLDPEHYGVLSIMIIFTTLANVFVQNGFNTALIQNKDVTEEDYSSVFWVSLSIAGVLYGVIYACAPLIGSFYEMPDLVLPLRVLALILFPGALNSIQVAKISREMNFKKIFVSNVAAVIISGVAGITIAYMGGGLWALVVQNAVNILVACVVMVFTAKLKLRFVCDFKRVKVLFSYGWKLLVSSLIDTLYQDLRSLVIGKKYDEGTLGYYNRGKQFPQFVINAINGAVQSVMLPAMALKQDTKDEVKALMRRAISVSAYIIFPMMAGLAACAEPLVRLLLTDKWLPCVPYLQIYCFTFAFYPVHTSNLQTINAMGRSDIFLKLEIIKKTYGIVALLIAIFCFDSPIAIAMTGVVTAGIGCFVNSFPNKKLIGYSYFEQMRDILPSFVASMVMFLGVWALSVLALHPMILLMVQVVVGVVFYLIVSLVFRFKPFLMIIDMVKTALKKKNEAV